VLLITPLRWIYFVAIALFTLLVGLQTYFAGVLFFAEPWGLRAHTGLGWSLGMISVLLPILAFAARVRWSQVGLTFLLLALTVVQVGLVSWWQSISAMVTALHPANALLIFALGALMAWRALGEARGGQRPGVRTVAQPVAA
jgi:hypothetical protein